MEFKLSFETNYFPLRVQRFIFSEDVSIVPTIFPVACPFTGKFIVSNYVTFPLLGAVRFLIGHFHDDIV